MVIVFKGGTWRLWNREQWVVKLSRLEKVILLLLPATLPVTFTYRYWWKPTPPSPQPTDNNKIKCLPLIFIPSPDISFIFFKSNFKIYLKWVYFQLLLNKSKNFVFLCFASVTVGRIGLPAVWYRKLLAASPHNTNNTATLVTTTTLFRHSCRHVYVYSF